MIRHKTLGIAVCFSFLAVFLACSDTSKSAISDLVESDLLSYGMPIIVLTPPNPVISKRDMRIQRELSIQKGANFSMDIYESTAVTRDVAAIKSRLLFEIQGNPYFQTVVEEDPQGFIYETAIDSNYINYGFRYFLLQGDNEYVFQSGLGTKFTLEDVQTMYSAVKASPN